jgi:hypothetical protein
MLWSFFQAIRIGSVDPHHLEATPRNWRVGVETLFVFAAFLALITPNLLSEAQTQFATAFVLAQSVAPAFTSPDRLRRDEAGFLERWITALKTSIGGSLIMKALGIALAWLVGRFIGDWWFFILLLVGILMIRGKGTTALLVLQADEGEYRYLNEAQRLAKLSRWKRIIWPGVFGYFFAAAGGFVIFRDADLGASDWNSWGGLLMGTVVRLITLR